MNLATYVLDHSELNFYLNKSNLTSFQYSEMDEKKHSFMQDLADSDYKKYNIELKKEVEELRQKEIKQAKEVKIERSGRGRGR